MIKGAIFDLDGTLLDSMWIWDTIGETYLLSLGITPKEDINALFRTFSLTQAAEYYIKNYNVRLSVEQIMEGVNKIVEEYYFNTVQLKNGVKEFLQILRKNNVKMCIATVTDRYQVEAALKRIGIKDYFTDILTCREIGHGKNQPIIYREALKKLGTKKSNTLVFEDAFYALKTASDDGFLTVGIYDKYNDDIQKIQNRCDIYLQDYINTKEFFDFVEKM